MSQILQLPFLHAFEQFWSSEPGQHLLSTLRQSACQHAALIRGWTQGGCLVAAEGIRGYLLRSLDPCAAGLQVSLVAVATDETEAAHVLVALGKDGQECFLDATGVRTREDLLRQLARQYQDDVWSLVRWEEVAHDQGRIPFDGQIAQAVAATLSDEIGPFAPASVFSSSVQSACDLHTVATMDWEKEGGDRRQSGVQEPIPSSGAPFNRVLSKSEPVTQAVAGSLFFSGEQVQ